MQTTHRIDVVHGLIAIIAFAWAAFTLMLGLHIIALGFLLCGLCWLWPQAMGRIGYVILMALATAVAIFISVILPWWLAHKTWVWVFGQ